MPVTPLPASHPLDRSLLQQLEAARAELQELTYTVSHDLRAPLRHIAAYSQVIAEDWPDMPTDVAAHLNTIRQSAQLLTQQLDGLAQLSRLGQTTLNLQAQDVNKMAQGVADELMQRLPHAVQWHWAGDVPHVLADAQQLRQVLVHLLGNAIKFSRNRHTAQITLTWRVDDHVSGPVGATVCAPPMCHVSIHDNGVGFAALQATALFKVFGRLHPVRDFEGLGLGLVTCRKIIERMGGIIGMEGAPDNGCCVTFGLPLAQGNR